MSPANSFFVRGIAQNFLALEGNNVVGRVTAIRQTSEAEVGLLGFFESVEDFSVAEELVKQTLAWFKDKGVKKIFAPMNFDTWHSYRFKIDGFDRKPFFMEPYNKKYYGDFFGKLGFQLEEEYFSKNVAEPKLVYERLMHKCRNFLDGDDVLIENWRRQKPQDELKRLYELSLRIFKGNWGYVDISEQEFMDLYKGSLSLLDPELVFFAKDKTGKDIGFLYAFPDYSTALRAMKGSRGWWAKIQFALHKKKPDTVNIKSMGVVPEARQTRLGAALVAKAYEALLRKNYTKVNHCLIIQGNYSGGYDGGLGKICGRYGLYSKVLE